MAVSGTVKLEVIASAEENIRAVLKQSNAAIRKTSSELEKAAGAQGKMGRTIDQVKGKALAFKGAILAMGAAAAYAAAQQLGEFTKEGARMADQMDAVRGRVENLDEIIAETQIATTGIVDEASIVQGAALFDAFGLEIAQLPALFEEASKTSLRTGESVDFLISSAVTGIARMSPPILDNLGLQVKLADATQAAAEKFGVEADALDEAQKKAGMLSIVLGKLGEQNKDIRLNESRVASIQRLEVQWKDTSNAIAQSFADIFKTSGDRMEEFTKTSQAAIKTSGRLWEDLTQTIEEEIKKQGLALNEQEGDQLRASSMQDFFVEKTIALKEYETTALNRLRFAKASANTEALRRETVAKITADGLQIYDAERWDAIQERHAEKATERNKTELKQIKLNLASRYDELVARDAMTEVMIEDSRRRIAIARGDTAAQLRLADAKKEVAIAFREGSDEAIKAAEKEVIAAMAARDKEKASTKTRVKSTKSINDGTDSILAKIIALENELRIEKAVDATAKARARLNIRDGEITKEALKIKDATLRQRFEEAAYMKSEIEFLREKNEIAAAGKEAGAQLAAAQASLDIARATTEEDKIRLGLAANIATIEADQTIPLAERLLIIKQLEVEAERDLGSIQAANMEQMIDNFADIAGGSFGEAATSFAKMDEALDKLGRPKRFEQISAGFQALSSQSGEISKAVSLFASGIGKANDDVAKGAIAAVGAVGPVVAAFGKTIAEKSAIQMAFELAMGTALMFVPGAEAEAAAHFTAAAMFGVIAGIAAAQPTVAAAGETAGAGGLITPAGGVAEREREAQSFTINLGPGTIFGLPQEMGREIADRIASMSGSGFEESTAF